MAPKVKINRAPVLTMWAFVVAERMGHSKDTALTLGRALAGLNAQSKGQRLGIYEPASSEKKEEEREKHTKADGEAKQKSVELLGRQLTLRETEAGWRAEAGGKVINPDGVETYLKQKFKDQYSEALAAMQALARSFEPASLERQAYQLYEDFRPAIPEGKRGWGAAGELDLDKLQSLNHA
jgi:hypothetical protein